MYTVMLSLQLCFLCLDLFLASLVGLIAINRLAKRYHWSCYSQKTTKNKQANKKKQKNKETKKITETNEKQQAKTLIAILGGKTSNQFITNLCGPRTRDTALPNSTPRQNME